MTKTMLTTKELAERWSMAIGTCENWRQQGKGPRWVKMGKTANSDVRYRLRDVEAYEKNNLAEKK